MRNVIRILISFAVLLGGAKIALAQSSGDNLIVLRDLTRVRGTVTSFDQTGVTLSSGSKLGWHQILQAKVEPVKQESFNQNIKQIGLPIFRLKTRVNQGDWLGAGEIADPIFESQLASQTASPDLKTNYLVCLATTRGRLREGRRAEAVLPFINSLKFMSQSPKPQSQKPEFRNQKSDKPLGGLLPLQADLAPVWFNTEPLGSCVSGLSVVKDSAATNAVLAIYLASMKIEIGETESAKQLLDELDSNSPSDLGANTITSWKTILNARMLQLSGDHVGAQTLLEKNEGSISGPARAAAIYYLGISKIEVHADAINKKQHGQSGQGRQDDPLNPGIDLELSKASLILLRIPAFYGKTHPELAAAALSQVSEIAKLRGHQEEHQKLRDELFRRYPRTYHGSVIKPR